MICRDYLHVASVISYYGLLSLIMASCHQYRRSLIRKFSVSVGFRKITRVNTGTCASSFKLTTLVTDNYSLQQLQHLSTLEALRR